MSKLPRTLLILFAVIALGGAAGGYCGWAMDAFPAIGLTSEKFWRTDPENLWVSSILVGAGIAGISAGLALGCGVCCRDRESAPCSRDENRQ